MLCNCPQVFQILAGRGSWVRGYRGDGGGGWFFTDNNTTPTKLFLFVLLVGLWQLDDNVILSGKP
jgi:hypothetical protein